MNEEKTTIQWSYHVWSDQDLRDVELPHRFMERLCVGARTLALKAPLVRWVGGQRDVRPSAIVLARAFLAYSRGQGAIIFLDGPEPTRSADETIPLQSWTRSHGHAMVPGSTVRAVVNSEADLLAFAQAAFGVNYDFRIDVLDISACERDGDFVMATGSESALSTLLQLVRDSATFLGLDVAEERIC